jgi:hypothetical protein
MSILRRLSNTSKAVQLGANAFIAAIDTSPPGGPYSANASYTINGAAGTYTISKTGNMTSSTTVRWGFRGNYSNYYVRATLIANDTPTTTATLGQWWQTNVNRTWSHPNTTNDTALRSVLRIEISNRASGSVILDSHEVEIQSQTGA